MVDDPGTLVSTEWLAAHLAYPDLRVIDASYHLPEAGATPVQSTRRRTSPAPGSSISTTCRTRATRCRTWHRRPRSS